MTKFKEQTLIEGRKIYDNSLTNQCDVTFEQLVHAYQSSGHTDENFLRNLRNRAIYQDLTDLDNHQILDKHYKTVVIKRKTQFFYMY